MRFRFTVEINLSHVSGQFKAKDEIASEIEAALNDAAECDIVIDETEYRVESYLVDRSE